MHLEKAPRELFSGGKGQVLLQLVNLLILFTGVCFFVVLLWLLFTGEFLNCGSFVKV